MGFDGPVGDVETADRVAPGGSTCSIVEVDTTGSTSTGSAGAAGDAGRPAMAGRMVATGFDASTVVSFHPAAETRETAVISLTWKSGETSSSATIPLGGCTGPAT